MPDSDRRSQPIGTDLNGLFDYLEGQQASLVAIEFSPMVLLQKRIGEVSAITRRKRTVNPFRGPVGHDVEYPRLLAVLDKDKIPRVEIKQRLRISLEELRPEVQ